MKASDVMMTPVVSVRPDMGMRQVAKLLLEKGISAVPVVDDAGTPIGLVSESDLIGRDDSEQQEERRDWWLRLLAEGEFLNPDFLANLHPTDRQVSEVMARPVISVNEETTVPEIARLMITRRIGRVPVVRDGRVVGIVSRTDLVRALAEGTHKPTLEGGAQAEGRVPDHWPSPAEVARGKPFTSGS